MFLPFCSQGLAVPTAPNHSRQERGGSSYPRSLQFTDTSQLVGREHLGLHKACSVQCLSPDPEEWISFLPPANRGLGGRLGLSLFPCPWIPFWQRPEKCGSSLLAPSSKRMQTRLSPPGGTPCRALLGASQQSPVRGILRQQLGEGAGF